MDPTALGRYLRESRESREITLEDAVRALRIRRDILEAFEQGEFNTLDSTVRTRGMLRNYANYLGLDEERVLQYYEASLSTKRRRGRFGRSEPQMEPIAPAKITDTPPALPAVQVPDPLPSGAGLSGIFRNLAMFLVSLAAVAVIVYVIMDTVNSANPTEEVVVGVTPVGSVTVTPTNTPTITPRATTSTATPDAFALGIVGVQVVVEMEQRSWVRVTADDIDVYTGILEPDQTVTYEANENVTIIAANAAALDVTYNTIPQDTFGLRGQQVELVFTTAGVEVNLGDGAAPTATQTLATSATDGAPEQAPATDQANQQTASTIANAPQPTNTQSGAPTPTPLFAVDTPIPVATDAATVADTQQSESESSTTQSQGQPSPTQANVTQQPTPIASTPTSAVVLPERSTPVPSATKSG